MQIISVLNQKGGSGKTTVATHLAHAISNTGASVVLGDCDPQGSAREWADCGGGDLLPVIGLDRVASLRDLSTIQADFLILDGPPKHSDLTAAAIRVSDLVIMPIQPSPYDLWAVDDLVQLVAERREISGGQPKAAFLISRAIPRTVIAREILEPLAEYEGIPVLDSRTYQRVSYPASAASGTTVLTGDDESAKAEILSLQAEILGLLK